MNHLLIRHKVADFAKWKRAYNAHAAVRHAAGLKELHLLRNVAVPNEVVILFAAANLAKAKALIASADMKVAMQKAGVIGKPDLCFLK
jgi:heme-degrading monooxygenase HmoA